MTPAVDHYPQYHSDVPYSSHSPLNTLDVCLPRPPSTSPSQLWLVYIHGGAWLDPEILASSFNATQALLLQDASNTLSHIAGIASLDYRLSPAASHPRLPSHPEDPARNARHPDHINDILTALLYLQHTYSFEDRYLLIGHSCGATLALQVAMKRFWGAQYEAIEALEMNVVPPFAVLGVEGLYHLPALVQYHAREPAYRDFVVNAFGTEEGVWQAVSPACGDWGESVWDEGRLVVLAQSKGDELVEWEQTLLMVERMKEQGWSTESARRRVKVLEVEGKHDQVWQEGHELARAIGIVVKELVEVLV